jgi:methyl coenzyme M reductase subunit C-like uncharacterized protein (methanogenesis marker protein 7)
MTGLAEAVGDLGKIVSELRKSEAAGADAELALEEVRALEAFAECARSVLERRKKQTAADAAVGTAVPVAGLLAILL